MRQPGRWLLLVLVSASARPLSAAAVGQAGTEPYAFLSLDANARPAGMAGAYTAVADDANSLLYNPAGLAREKQNEVTFMHNQHLQGITQDYGAVALPFGLGLNFNILDFGDVTRTSLSNPNGGIGTAGMSDQSLGIGYGASLTDNLSVGAGAKWIRETIDVNVSNDGAFDFGAQYKPPLVSGLVLGAAVQNLGPPAHYQRSFENLPTQLRAGAAYTFTVAGKRNVLALDLLRPREQSPIAAIGFETMALAPLAVRAGFNTGNDAGPGATFGFAYVFKSGSIDYAFVPMGDLGDTHRVSITLRWDPGSLHLHVLTPREEAEKAAADARRRAEEAAAKRKAASPTPAPGPPAAAPKR